MLIFVDIETTGVGSLDRICSIAVIGVDSKEVTSKYDLVNEGKKISSKASSVNHITNEMIKDRVKLEDSQTYKFFKNNNNKNSTLITHNVKFVLKMLSKSGFEWRGEIVDTLRVTKHLIAECEEFSLGFLRYELKLYRDEKQEALICFKSLSQNEIIAHSAISDALDIKLLYKYLLNMQPFERLIELSFKNVLMKKFEFGKYKGRYIEEISMCDRGYLEWMLRDGVDLDEELRYSVIHYLQGDL